MDTTITRTTWKNLEALCLENGCLRVILLPVLGGKLASVFYKKKAFELAARNKEDFYRLPGPEDAFSRYDASGLDDAFPCIDPCEVETLAALLPPDQVPGSACPDHGEIWRSPMKSRILPDRVLLSFESPRFPYFYQKSVSLSGEKLLLDYEIRNTGETPFPCLWAFHGLVRYEEDMEFFYSRDVQTFENVLDSPELGPKGGHFSLGDPRYDFTRVPPKASRTMVKYYADRKVRAGFCGYRYPSQGVCCTLRYDARKLPYLGLWITAGGFRGDYNCALEPANGYYDSIPEAAENRSLYFLKKEEPLRFSLELALSEA